MNWALALFNLHKQNFADIENAFSELLNDFTMYLIIVCDYANSIFVIILIFGNKILLWI
jgi:hypothetical protein